jgi:hypothetical protein
VADNTYDSTTRHLTVNASARFYGAITDNFRINCYIVEDSVIGPSTSGYNQINAYNTASTTEWYQRGNPIVGFPHRDVVRKMLGGAWGSTGVISSTTADGGLYTKVYADSLKSTWKAAKVKLVVLVQHYATDSKDREILNAMEMDLNAADSTAVTFPTAISEVTTDKIGSVSLFPNPASDVVNLSYSLNEATNVSFEVYNVIGQAMTAYTPTNTGKGGYRTQINTAGFNNGVYFVAVKNGNKVVQTLKFIVSK